LIWWAEEFDFLIGKVPSEVTIVFGFFFHFQSYILIEIGGDF